jgi:hypothetical protein
VERLDDACRRRAAAVMRRFSKATDGAITVFRSSETRVYLSAWFTSEVTANGGCPMGQRLQRQAGSDWQIPHGRHRRCDLRRTDQSEDCPDIGPWPQSEVSGTARQLGAQFGNRRGDGWLMTVRVRDALNCAAGAR